MYTTYFGFENKPFKPKDLTDYYRNDNLDSACADILKGARERRGFMVLTGEAGLGKTLLLRRCMAEAKDIFFVLITNAGFDFSDILSYLCASLRLPIDDLDIEQRSRLLADTVAAHARRNQPVTLLIDDAHHLRVQEISRLRDFVEATAEPELRLQVVLAGLPEIEGKLRQPELRSLWEQIGIRHHLERLSALETELFINHQFKTAGYSGETLFSFAVFERIDHYSRGVPRAIAMLCDAMFLFASLESEHEITPAVVDEAARNCFLGERTQRGFRGTSMPLSSDIASKVSPKISDEGEFDLRLDLDLPLDFSLDLDLNLGQTHTLEQSLIDEGPAVVAENPQSVPSLPPLDLNLQSLPSSPLLAKTPVGGSHASQPMVADPILPRPKIDTPTKLKPAQATGWTDTATPATTDISAKLKPNQAAGWASTAAPAATEASIPQEFSQLLGELTTKQDRKEQRDREAVDYFLNRYLHWTQGGPAWAEEYQRRIAHLAETPQAILVSLVIAVNPVPEQDNVLCALLINPSWWLYREIRLRLRSPELAFADEGRVPSLRLLDGREVQPVYVSYRSLRAGPVQTTLWLELDLCDHRGEWHAYNNRFEIRLDFTGSVESELALTDPSPRFDHFWPDPLLDKSASNDWLLDHSATMYGGGESSALACTLPLELEVDPDRSYSLHAASVASGQMLSRGTSLTRALLLPENSAQAVARIELVSRPLMIFGRHSSTAGTGFGDFTLGFVPRYNRISRLHCVICALGDQLALMPVSDQGYTFTGRNEQRLERGSWQLLEANDVLDICDLYRLRLSMVWDNKGERTSPDWDSQEPRDKFGNYLLDLVEVLHQRDQQADIDALRDKLKARYLKLLRMQETVAQLNGIGNPGTLLYAKFEREDAARRQIVHYYVPKWLPIGSSPQAGLRLHTPGVAPWHAELLFRDGMYWIQNLAESGSVRVGCHDLATNEVLALEAGDTLKIGGARFTFEAY